MTLKSAAVPALVTADPDWANAAAAPSPIQFARWLRTRDGVCAALLAGESRVAVIGHAGAGKTTLLDAAAQVLTFAGWQVTVCRAGDPAALATRSRRGALLIDDADLFAPAELEAALATTDCPVLLAAQDMPESFRAGVRIALPPLTTADATEFIELWLAQAEQPARLDARTMSRIIELSGGAPGLLVTLLNLAVGAPSADQQEVPDGRDGPADEIRALPIHAAIAAADLRPGRTRPALIGIGRTIVSRVGAVGRFIVVAGLCLAAATHLGVYNRREAPDPAPQESAATTPPMQTADRPVRPLASADAVGTGQPPAAPAKVVSAPTKQPLAITLASVAAERPLPPLVATTVPDSSISLPAPPAARVVAPVLARPGIVLPAFGTGLTRPPATAIAGVSPPVVKPPAPAVVAKVGPQVVAPPPPIAAILARPAGAIIAQPSAAASAVALIDFVAADRPTQADIARGVTAAPDPAILAETRIPIERAPAASVPLPTPAAVDVSPVAPSRPTPAQPSSAPRETVVEMAQADVIRPAPAPSSEPTSPQEVAADTAASPAADPKPALADAKPAPLSAPAPQETQILVTGTFSAPPVAVSTSPTNAVAVPVPAKRPVVREDNVAAEMTSLMLRRGRELLALGDLSAARLMFGRAAAAGSPVAMLEMGRTYDSAERARSLPRETADQSVAESWYRSAAAAGNTEALVLLQHAQARPRR